MDATELINALAKLQLFSDEIKEVILTGRRDSACSLSCSIPVGKVPEGWRAVMNELSCQRIPGMMRIRRVKD